MGDEMVIETSCNQFYRVRETGDASLAHVWYGVAVKRVRCGKRATASFDYIPKANAREIMVRKAGSRVMES